MNLEIEVKEDQQNYLLPPLTLQLLLENALKHNTVLPEKPLMIRMYADEGDNLVVVNNLHKKNMAVQSNKLGLKTIVSKYKLMNKGPVLIKETGSVFQVMIPLIKNNIYESVAY